MLCVELEEAGFEVVPTSGARAVAAQLKDGRSSVAVSIIDLDMHSVDEACRILREVRAASPDALVIMAVSEARPPLPPDCEGASILRKPYTPEELYRLLQDAPV